MPIECDESSQQAVLTRAVRPCLIRLKLVWVTRVGELRDFYSTQKSCTLATRPERNAMSSSGQQIINIVSFHNIKM